MTTTTEKQMAERWLDERGYTDGQDWDAEQAMADAAKANDHIGSTDDDGPSPCRWRVYNQKPGEYPVEATAEEHPGYVWADGSGVYVTEGWWDVITHTEDGQPGVTGAGTIATGPV